MCDSDQEKVCCDTVHPVLIITSPAKQTARFLSTFNWLADRISLINPGLGAVTSWNDEGQFTTTETEVRRCLTSGKPGNVQFWFDISTDLFVDWSPDGFRIHIYRSEDQLKLLDEFIRHFVTLPPLDPDSSLTLCLEYTDW